MLNVYVGGRKDEIFSTAAWFDWNYEDNWITNPSTVETIKDIDKSEVLGNGAIKSPVLGIISPREISGGVKTLILIDNDPTRIFCANQLGDNCGDWLLNIAYHKDIYVSFYHILKFKDQPKLKIKIMNSGRIVTNFQDYVYEFISVNGD